MASLSRFTSVLFVIMITFACGGQEEAPQAEQAPSGRELPATKVPGLYAAAESYFSPDGRHLILNAKRDSTEAEYHTYVVSLDGAEIRRINDRGMDACSFFFPDGQKLIFTSTRDNPDMPGDFSDTQNYPKGAELYICDPDGSNVKRLTNNALYEAEVSISPDGQWVLFGRQTAGKMDLWRMRPDGSDAFQITRTDDLQEGGAFYMPDSEHIIFRAWKKEDEGSRGLPMTIYTTKHDGTELTQITTDPGMNWAPYPSPDGKHFAYVRMLDRGNFEVFLMNIETKKKIQVTYNPAFDGYPSFSPDGKTISFSSSRGQPPGVRRLDIFLMDIGPLMDD